ncbi:MAG: 1-acyl-sn-glycerol-3-phosphate acyltransferase [Magnetococcales bacterium]|nr:1-acyl-sn-glycerol-3-phosphate acyltransferase [Magnetococcales bacterium]
MEKFKTWVRSSLFFFLFVVGIISYATAIMVVWPVTSVATRQGMARSWSRFNRRLLELTCGLGDRVMGLEHLPEPPFILLSKHQSAWETVIFAAIFPPLVLVLKKSLLNIPFFGWALKATDQIAIDRSRGVEAMRKMQQAGQDHFDQGVSVLIFPEGTRTAPGSVGKYNAGGISLALSSGLPIVPIAHNAGRFWGRRSFLKHPGEIQVRIGQPILTAGRPKSDRKALLKETREVIEGMMGEIDREGSAPLP